MQWALPGTPSGRKGNPLFLGMETVRVRGGGECPATLKSQEEDPERIYVAWSVSSSSHKHLPLPPTPVPHYPRDLPRKEPEPLKD